MCSPHAAAETTLWDRSSAAQWDHAMPLGNGRLGAMVFGNANRERIQLNQSSLWTGGKMERDTSPGAEAPARGTPAALRGSAGRCLQILADKDPIMARPQRLQSYQTLGDLRLTFDHEEAIADITAVSSIWIQGSFASRTALARPASRGRSFRQLPDQALVVRIVAHCRRHSASRSGWIARRMPPPMSTAAIV